MKTKIILIFWLYSISSYATDYYVDATNGNDSNNGTSIATAWKTLTNVNSTMFFPGDSILFKAGESWVGTIKPQGSGAIDNPITIGMYGTGNRPAIHGDGAVNCTLEPGVTKYCTIFLNNQEYWIIRDLEVTNYDSSEESGKTLAQWETDNINNYANISKPNKYAGSNSKKCAIMVEANNMGAVNSLHFINLEVHGVNGDISQKNNGGIFLRIFNYDPANAVTYFDDLLIEDCYVHDVDRTGISNVSDYDNRTFTTNTDWTPSLNVVIRNNTFERTGANALIVRVAENPLIENNLFDHCSIKETGNAAFNFNTDGALWQFNESRYTKYNIGDHDAGGMDSDYRTKNTIMQYNYMHDNDFGMLITGGPASFNGFNDKTIVRYNIFENDGILKGAGDGAWSFKISGLATNTEIHNNVIYIGNSKDYNDIVYHKSWGGWPDATTYTNNIFYNDGTNTDFNLGSSTVNSFTNNVFYGNTMTNEPSDQNKLISDPLLTNPGGGENGYELQANSPALASGLRLSTTPDKDYYQNNVGANIRIDRGLHQASNILVETVFVAEDSYVRSGANTNINYGSEDFVKIKESTNLDFTRRGYLKFDLSNLSPVESAELKIYGKADQQIDLSVFFVSDDNWQESAITWDNAPAFSSTNSGIIPLQVTNQWYSLDITALVQSELASDGILTIGLKDEQTLVKNIDIFSKENSGGQFKAYLSITNASELTLSSTADSFVRSGTHANSNFGTDLELDVKLASANFTRESYLKFDVSSLSNQNIDSVKLVLEPSSLGSNASLTQMEVKAVSDDSWTESGITWNNKPTQGSLLDSKAGSSQTMEWDVTSQVVTEVSSDGILTLALSSTVSGGQNFVNFHSKEATDQTLRPKLVVLLDNLLPGQGDKDIFLVIGQSNTAGRADIEAKDIGQISNVYLLNAQNQWETSENPLNKHSTIRKDLSVQGLAYAHTFSKHMQEILSKDIGLVVNARGGSNINEWVKGATADYYGEALTRIQAALNIPGSNLRGILWHQGESNRNDGLSYITKLEGIINDFRTDLNMPNLPLIAGQLSQDRSDNDDFNTNVIPTLPSTVTNTDYVKSDYLHTSDLTHFNSEAQRVLGGRYAGKILEKSYGYQIVTDTVWVDKDSYVRSGVNSDNNYNSQTVLRVKTSANADFTRESFLKFDLSNTTDQIIDAILVVNGSASEGGTLTPTFYETTDGWSESTITWNNKPASGNELEMLEVSGTTVKDYMVFLSEFAQETQNSDGILSITIKDNGTSGKQFRFKSKEDTANQNQKPYLLVTTVSLNTSAKSSSNGNKESNNFKEESNIVLHSIDEEIKLYPNPAKNRIYFKNINAAQRIYIIDINGKSIINRKNINTISKYGLDISALPKGMYFVLFDIKGKGIINKKLIIN